MIGILNFGNHTNASTAYPYGNIKDDPGDGSGTTVNVQSNADLHQFFARIMANAGITASANPDNFTNGWQMVQAINAMISAMPSAFASTVGAGAGNNYAVRVSGLAITGTSTLTVTAGYFFYNGKMVYYGGGTVANNIFGQVPLVTVGSLTDTANAYVATITSAATATDATHFPLSALNTYAQGLGLTALANTVSTNTSNISTNTAAIAAINAALPIPAWTVFGSGLYATSWAKLGSGTANFEPRYTKDAQGRVYIQGRVSYAGSGGTSKMFTLPGGYRPSQDVGFGALAIDNTATCIPCGIVVQANGDVSIAFPYNLTSSIPTVLIDCLNFITL